MLSTCIILHPFAADMQQQSLTYKSYKDYKVQNTNFCSWALTLHAPKVLQLESERVADAFRLIVGSRAPPLSACPPESFL